MGYGRRSEMIDGQEQVFCTHCQQYKPVGEFLLRTPERGLYQYYCRSCQAEIDHINNERQLEERGGRKLVMRIPDSKDGYCPHCKQWKPKSEFNFYDTQKGTLQTYCRDCQHEVDREHYLSHRERILERNKAATHKGRDEAREYVYQYLLSHHCVDCGESDPVVLTFDHINADDKTDHVASMVAQGRTLDVVKAEIDKCEVVCHNCHNRRTQQRQGAYRWRRQNGG